MHYYTFHIGDYASHTRHLSLLEDLAYRRLLDAYYLAEKPITGLPADVAREIGMADHVDAVAFVLTKFFACIAENTWQHGRCDEEIAHVHKKSEQASRAGKASAERRFNGRSTDVQPPNTQHPIPNTQKKNTAAVAAPPDGVSQSVWSDFLQHRKAKKAPVTQSAIEGIKREAQKAGWTLQAALQECCVRGWQGFKADWVVESKPVQQITTPSRQGIDTALHKLEQDKQKAVPLPAEIRQKIASLTRKIG